MLRVIVKRLMVSIPVLIGVLFIGFMLLVVVPSDPAAIIAGEGATPEILAGLHHDLGLDRPVLERFALYIGRVLQGDLGKSVLNRSPVIDELLRTIGPTAELMLCAMLVAIPIGIGLGTLGAVTRGRWIDRTVMMVSVAGLSMPGFMIALLGIEYFGLQWGLLPFQGRGGPLWTWDGLAPMVLPAVSLGSILIGPIARMTRTSMLDVLGLDFIRTARAKGLGETRVVLKHALRTALIPVITLIGLQAGYLLGGAVVTETIFAWPGIGRLAVTAITSSDFPMAQGTILMLALSFIIINLMVDLLYSWLDPRMRQ
ncbi:ABC transporter permease [Roseixanthobacter liquoris]|uniref:ABC transporter permease n=1 Tax=Roseixanthobacter liquoris TaxID=3119921 RepID=UPI00372A9258